jgi:hypothetical protein
VRLSRSEISAVTYPLASASMQGTAVKTTYAVKWREPDGETYLGRLELQPKALLLEGRSNGREAISHAIGYDELGGFHMGQTSAERLDGQPSLVVERSGGDVLITSSVMHAGVLQELVHRLAELRLAVPRRLTIIIPLKEGALEQARELAAGGPPFDPEALPISRHQLLLTPAEAIFVFESDRSTPFEALLGQVDVLAAAASWHDLVAGPPRLAEIAYAWERPPVTPKIGLGF